MTTRLRDLGAQVTTLDYGDGVQVLALVFECPNPRCERGHSQAAPYSDQPCHRVARPVRHGGGEIVVWQRVSGSTVDDLTLAPSFLVRSCDDLHGYVRGGCWEPC